VAQAVSATAASSVACLYDMPDLELLSTNRRGRYALARRNSACDSGHVPFTFKACDSRLNSTKRSGYWRALALLGVKQRKGMSRQIRLRRSVRCPERNVGKRHCGRAREMTSAAIVAGESGVRMAVRCRCRMMMLRVSVVFCMIHTQHRRCLVLHRVLTERHGDDGPALHREPEQKEQGEEARAHTSSIGSGVRLFNGGARSAYCARSARWKKTHTRQKKDGGRREETPTGRRLKAPHWFNVSTAR